MQNVSTREKNYKEGIHMGLKHTRTRKKYYLKDGPYRNSKKRCSGCDKPPMKLKGDHGAHFPKKERYEEPCLYCPRCKVVFPKYSVVVSLVGQYH